MFAKIHISDRKGEQARLSRQKWATMKLQESLHNPAVQNPGGETIYGMPNHDQSGLEILTLAEAASYLEYSQRMFADLSLQC